jgi:regulation of enolase protein 1 (concanavalin A-like superfamily)/uncharacterized membrane protein
MRKRQLLGFTVGLLTLALFCPMGRAQRFHGSSHARTLITQGVDENKRVTLSGNVRPEARAEHDRGRAPNDLLLDHILLQLKRSPEQERALEEFLQELQTQGSPNYQQWISAAEFGERFGVAAADIEKVTDWMEKHGLTINVVYPSNMVIDFSGTARQVNETFHTEIHQLRVRGKDHIGNINDPQVPAALAPVVAGIVSLNNFPPHNMHLMRKNATFPDGFGGTTFALAPADLATIYNVNPLFASGLTGQGQTVVVIEDTDVFSAADWAAFRNSFGLSKYTSGSFKTTYPAPATGVNNCKKPGVVAPNDAEAILDAEWASAAAPAAAIVMATCADTTTTFGGLIALQNLINAKSQPPAILSISYGQCETENGATANASYNSAYQQAVSEGVSVFVAAGDSGAAGCDNSAAQASHGIGVNAFASTPYNVAVGGTDFSDTFSGTNSTYWSSANGSTFGSALSYIPEIPWNDSCAGALFASFEGFSVPYGPDSLCNDPTFGSFTLSTVAGGGGPSACATGSPSTPGVVSGTCKGWPKPAWQSLFGNPSDGVRDTPDVSLFAADGLWSHYYLFCWSDTANGGTACTGDPTGWSGAGGTSFAAPIMAGIQALANQKAGGRQGNPNPTYYQLAANEYNTTNGVACNSSNGNTVPNSCIFYDVTQGDMDVNCIGNANCFLDGSAEGVLSTSNNSFQPAYPAAPGWDFATGIGTLNAANLVNNWPGSKPTFSLSTTASSLSVPQNGTATTTVNVLAFNGFTGSVSLSASGLPSGVTASFNPSSTTTSSTLTFSASTAAALANSNVTITGKSGTLTMTTIVVLSVVPPGTFTLSVSPSKLSVVQGASGTSTVTVLPQSGFTGSVTLSASGLPTGVTAAFNPATTTSTSTLTLSANSIATVGAATVTITGTAGGLTSNATLSVTINPGPTYSLSASPNTVSIYQGTSGSSTVSITPQNGFTGSVSLSASGLPTGVTASFSPANATSSSTLTLSASSAATTGTVTVTITGNSGSLSKTITLTLTVTAAPLPSNWVDLDIGAVGMAGSASYLNGVFTTNGSGQYIWNNSDQFNFAYQGLSGDGTIVARLVSSQGGANQQSVGVMIRESLNANSANAYALFGGGNSEIYLTDRPATAGLSTSAGNTAAVTLPYWVKLVRSGNTFTGYASADGANWTQVGAAQINMAQSVYVGLAVSSNDNGKLTTATFDNVSITVPPPNFSLTASSFTVAQGASGTSTITVTPQNGFTGSVNLSASGLPSGVTASFNPTSTANSSTLTLTVSGSAATGTFPVTVTGVSGTLTNTTAFNLTITPPSNFSLSASPGTLSIAQGGSGTSTVTVTAQNGFTGSVSLAASGLPTGVSASFSPASTTSTSTLTLSAGSSATTGTVTVTITGTSGSLTQTAVLTLTVSATAGPLPSGWTDLDIGVIGLAGSANYTNGVFTVNGSGAFIWNSSDQFNFAYQPLSGDGTIVARVLSAQGGANNQSVGLMIRESLNPNATNAYALFGGGNAEIYLTDRSSTAGSSIVVGNTAAAVTLPYWVKLVRSGSTFTGYASPDGANWTQVASAQISMAQSVYMGMAVSSNDNSKLTTATFDNVSITVPPPNFSLSASPVNVTVAQGASGTSTITVTPQNGFTGNVNLSASGLPSGVTASFNPTSTAHSSTLTLAVSGSVATGTFPVTVTGTSGSLNNAASVSLTVVPPPSFTLSASPSMTIAQGSSGASTISVTGQNGFSDSVSLSATGLPNGVTATFTPNSTTTTSSLTLSASSSATLGTATVTITGTAGTLTSTVTINLTVTAPPNYTVGASPNSMSIAQGGSGTSTVTVTAQNGFTGSVSLAASGLPTGVSASFSPASTTSTSTLTLSAGSSATTGTVTVTITGTSGSLTQTAVLTLTVSATAGPLPSGWTDLDIGVIGLAGSANYTNGVFTVNGSGAFIWNSSDQFNFAYQPLSGDGTIVARVLSAQGGANNQSVGLMIRESLNPNATNAYALFGGGNAEIYLTDRSSTAGSSIVVGNTAAAVTLPYWVKLVRSGSTFTGYASPDGANWTQVASAQISMAQSVYMGMAVSSNDNSKLTTATFDNVSITVPPPNFSLSASPVNVTVAQGASGTSTITVTPQNGFTGSVNLSASGLPSGVTASFNPASTASSSTTSSTLTFTVSGSATTGTFPVTVTGTSASVVQTTTVNLTVSAANALPLGWADLDIGPVGPAGTATFSNGVFTVNGSGQYIWNTVDGFHFVYESLSGDGTIVARVLSAQGGSSSQSAGVMIRENLNSNSSNAYTLFSGNSEIFVTDRPSAGALTVSLGNTAAVGLPYWVKLIRSGNTLTGYASPDGVSWTQVGATQISMLQNVYIGLAVSSDDNARSTTATFDNVSVTTP